MSEGARYERELAGLREAFPSPDADPLRDASIADVLADALRRALALKTAAPQLSGLPRRAGAAAVDARLPVDSQPLPQVIDELLERFHGLPLEVHPRHQVNVNVQPSTAGLAGVLLPALFNPNLSSDGRGAGCSDAEREVTAMTAALVGYDPHVASGLFTFGGTGTMLYGVKLGLENAVPGAMQHGLDRPVVVLASERAHHTCLTAAGWLGIGQRQVWSIPAGEDNAMDCVQLQAAARRAVSEGRRIAAIVATVGTTDAFGLDDVAAAAAIRDELVRESRLDYVPHVHADAVIGWAWSVFTDYDFQRNPLEFDDDARRALESTVERVAGLAQADSLGVDFHKTGFAPYVSSLLVVRERQMFERLLRDRETMPYLFHSGAHHPGMYTLETTRSASGVLSALASLRMFGRRGLQVLLGHAVARAQQFRRRLAERPWAAVVNQRNGGPVTLYRAYPPGVSPSDAWRREREEAGCGPWSLEVNAFNKRMHAATQTAAKRDAVAGAGWTERAAVGRDGQPLAALKTYLLSPFLTDEHLDELLNNLDAAYDAASHS